MTTSANVGPLLDMSTARRCGGHPPRHPAQPV